MAVPAVDNGELGIQYANQCSDEYEDLLAHHYSLLHEYLIAKIRFFLKKFLKFNTASDGINHKLPINSEGKKSFIAQVTENSCATNGKYKAIGNVSLAINKKAKPISKLYATIKVPILMSFLLTSVYCHLEETPSNAAVINGDGQILFKCKSDEGRRLKWLMQKSDLSERQVLYSDYSIFNNAESFCHVENGEPGKFYLNLKIKREAAQTYICQEPDTNDEISVDLVIINKTQLQKEFLDDHVIIKCIVEFGGNWPPELEWSYNGTSIDEGVNTTTVPNTMVSSTLVLPLSAFDRNYTCTAKFDIRGKPQQTTSTNVPDYISYSVLTVEASQVYSDEFEGHSAVNGISTSLAIGLGFIILTALVVGITVVIYMRRQQRKVNKKTQKEIQMMLQQQSI